MVGHQHGRPALERVEHRLGQLRRPERLVAGHRHRPAEPEHLVVDARHLVDDAGERGGGRRVGVHDAAGVVALVNAEVQLDLRRRLERPVDERPVAVDDGHLVGGQIGEDAAGRRDRHVVAGARADVARGAGDEPLRRERAAHRSNGLPLVLKQPGPHLRQDARSKGARHEQADTQRTVSEQAPRERRPVRCRVRRPVPAGADGAGGARTSWSSAPGWPG